MIMMAKGLERQLTRCVRKSTRTEFCHDHVVFNNVVQAYDHLWELLEKNDDLLRRELWSWDYDAQDRKFYARSMTPDNQNQSHWSAVEGNALQLWSMGFLAVERVGFDFSRNMNWNGTEIWPGEEQPAGQSGGGNKVVFLGDLAYGSGAWAVWILVTVCLPLFLTRIFFVGA